MHPSKPWLPLHEDSAPLWGGGGEWDHPTHAHNPCEIQDKTFLLRHSPSSRLQTGLWWVPGGPSSPFWPWEADESLAVSSGQVGPPLWASGSCPI